MRILMITESSFPNDVRIRQEADKLRDHGHKIMVICLKDKKEPYFEFVNGHAVYRVPKIEVFKRGKHSKAMKKTPFRKLLLLTMGLVGYGFEFVYFTFCAFLASFIVLFREGFDVIHTHNPPDTLFVIARFHKLFGKKFVFDHHDLSPDLFREKYGSKGAVVYDTLLFFERISCQTADLVIATNESYRAIEVHRCGVRPENVFVVRNGPDLNMVKVASPIEAVRSKAGTILCYLGAINIQDGVENIVDVLGKIVFDHQYEDIYFVAIGDGDYLFRIKELAANRNLLNHVLFTGNLPDRNLINRYMSSADIFIDAAPYSFLNDNSTFIKHMEYMVYGKPVISFALKESMFSLQDAGVFVRSDDTAEMARVILDLIADKEKREDLGRRAQERVKELSWDKVSPPLLQAYKRLE